MNKLVRRANLTATTFIVLFVSPGLIHAEDFRSRLFGHDVYVGPNKDAQQQLYIDGKVAIKDSIVGIKDISSIDEVGVAIGYASAGGNACEAFYFVLAFPEDQAVRIDGPTGNCFPVKYVIGKKGIKFSTDASVTHTGETWDWTPSAGMSEKTAVAFSEDPFSNAWDDLRTRRISHPGELFKYSELGAQLDTLLGADRASVLSTINGVGGIEFKGDVVLATSCAPHQCDETGAIIAIDLPKKRLFLAWKPSKGPIIVRPLLKEWSPAARAELASWSRRWTR
jgi:hypothetical protein